MGLEVEEGEGGQHGWGTDEHGRRPYPVVAIGASAAAPEGLETLLRGLDLSGMAVALVVRGTDGDRSAMSAHLRDRLGDKLVEIADGTVIDRGRVYVAPDGADLALFHGTFHIMPPAPPSTPRLPIDSLLQALASDQGASAVGVVLAGTAPDGAFGLDAIKAEGGVAFHEDSGGRGDGARAHGADLVLAPDAIAGELAKISRRPYLTALRGATVIRTTGGTSPSSPQVGDELGKLFVLVRNAYGTDFSFYKTSTIARRVERRMVVRRFERLGDYVRFVQTQPDELDALYRDSLIGVTSFFRDPEAFEALTPTVLPRIIERKRPWAPLRVWIPGCATGEEAYSIAMSLFEHLDGKLVDVKLEIFATDLDRDAIERARLGCYPPTIARDVSPARLARFFTRHDSGFQISRRVRDTVVFAIHDVLREAPFSCVDLMSCRNLLIYLEPAAQKKVLRVFHDALNADGTLFLGASETVGDNLDLFSVVDKQHRIYAKKHVPSAAVFDVTFGAASTRRAEPPSQPLIESRPAQSLQQYADRKVLSGGGIADGAEGPVALVAIDEQPRG